MKRQRASDHTNSPQARLHQSNSIDKVDKQSQREVKFLKNDQSSPFNTNNQKQKPKFSESKSMGLIPLNFSSNPKERSARRQRGFSKGSADRKKSRSFRQKRNKSMMDDNEQEKDSEGVEEPTDFLQALDLVDPPRQKAGQPPAKELEDVWDMFIEESWRRSLQMPLIKELRNLSIFEKMTVLVLEKKGLEKIFQYLRPCVNLIAIYLKHNRVITRDLVQIQHLENLRKVDLSSNEIHFLPEPEELAKLRKLEYLQLHKNLLVGWRQLENLTTLKNLNHMTLQGNPCSKIKGYRKFLVDNMPQLRSLDEFIVMDFERKDIATMYPPENIKKHKLMELHRFRPFQKETTSWRCQRYEIPVSPIPKQEETKSGKKKVRKSHTMVTDQYGVTMLTKGINKHLDQQSYNLRRKFEFCSPILTIQKTIKMLVYRRKFLKKQRQTKILVWALNRWNKRGHVEHLLKKMGLNRQFLFMIGKVRFIQKTWRYLFKKWKTCKSFASRAQSIYRMKLVQNESLEKALGLNARSRKRKFTKLLFRKTQLDLISRIGLIQYAKKVQDSQRFSIRTSVPVDTLEIRRSPLMNLVISSYRQTRLIRASSFFRQAVQVVKDASQHVKVLQLVTDQRGNQFTQILNKDSQYNLSNSQRQKSASIDFPFSSPKSTTKNDEADHKSEEFQSVIDNENTLVEVTFENDFELASVLRSMASYNRRNAVVIQVFYEPFLQRYEATLLIQRWMKGLLFRRRTKPIFINKNNRQILGPNSLVGRSVTLDNTKYTHYVLIMRIAKRIQRFYRIKCLKRRIDTLTNIANYVAAIDSKKIYLEQTVYMNLQKVFQNATSAPWYKPKVSVSPTVVQPTTTRGGKKKIPLKGAEPKEKTYADTFESLFEKRFRFQISQKDHKITIHYSGNVDKTGRYSISNLPMWFQRKTNTEVPRIENNKKQPRFANNILSLIHIQPNPLNKGAPKIVNLSDLKEVRLQSSMMSTKLVKLNLMTTQEARNRAIVLALLTCDNRKSSHSFVRFFTNKDFVGLRRSNVTYKLIQGLLSEHRLVDGDKKTILTPYSQLQAQPHAGLIQKKQEPYTTLLRARPRDKKSHFERFIVLGDADPKHVEERLGNALISDEVIEKLKKSESEAKLNQSQVDNANLEKDDYGYVGSLNNKQVKAGGRTAVNLMGRKVSNAQHKDNYSYAVQEQLSSMDQNTQNNNSKSPRQKGLTNGDIAAQRQKMQQSRDKIYKIETLQRKLKHIKQMIDQSNERDPNFKNNFVKQLLQMVRSQNLEIKEIEQEDQEGERDDDNAGIEDQNGSLKKRTMVIEMPNTELNYYDPNAQIIDNDNIDRQIDNLFHRYVEQKKAYRGAMSLSLVNQQAKKKMSIKNIKDSGSLAYKAQQQMQHNLTSRLPQLKNTTSEASRPNESFREFLETSSNEFQNNNLNSNNNAELILNRFPDLQQALVSDQNGVTKYHMMKSRSSNTLKMQQPNLMNKKLSSRIIKTFKLKNKKNGLSNFIKNQSNSPLNITQKQLNYMREDSIKAASKKSVRSLKQSLNTQRMSYDGAKKNNSFIIEGAPSIKNSPNRTLGPHIFRTISTQNIPTIPNSPIRRHNPLKDASSILRRDSNVQRIRVQAHNIEFKDNIINQIARFRKVNDIPQVTGGGLEHSRSHQQLLEPIMKKTLTDINEFQAGIQSKQRQEKLESIYQITSKINEVAEGVNEQQQQQLPALKFQIPLVGQNREGQPIVSSDRSSEVEKIQKEVVTNQSTAFKAQLKTDEIIADLDAMKQDREREREIFSMQNNQAIDVHHQSKTDRAIVMSKYQPDVPEKIKPIKNRMQGLLDKRMNQIKEKKTERPKSTPKSKYFMMLTANSRNQQQANVNLTSIETIMRNRKQQEDNQKLLLQRSGVFNKDEYFYQDLEQQEQESEVAQNEREPFNYQVRDGISPKQSLVGLSRTRSVNKFTKAKRQRVLSFFPALQKQSAGKFTAIQ